MESTSRTYTARWIFPIDALPLERSTITIEGSKIVAVGTRQPAGVDLGHVAILPGFVNAHTHLDLSGARGECPPRADFTQWLRSVIAFRRTRRPEQVQADIAAGLAECLSFGTTSIGDIAAGGASWDLIGRSPCNARVFYELLGLSAERAEQSWRDVQDWRQRHAAMERCFAGLSPHAPYSVRRSLYQRFDGNSPIATHLAETREEQELLSKRSGPFVDFLKEMNVWDPSGLADGPVEVLRFLPHGIFVHCNYLDSATTFLPTQSVVVCPRTHAAFGHRHHPFPEMLKRNVRVALGTDSLASNPDLDILAEARFLRRHYPEVEPAALLRMLTLSGAEALGFDAITGSLTPGKSADLVVLPLPTDDRSDPHDVILASTLPVSGVMFRGEWIVEPIRGLL